MWHDARSHFQETLLWFHFLCEVICRHSSISHLTPCLKGDVFALPAGEATPCKETSAPETKPLSPKELMPAALAAPNLSPLERDDSISINTLQVSEPETTAQPGSANLSVDQDGVCAIWEGDGLELLTFVFFVDTLTASLLQLQLLI